MATITRKEFVNKICEETQYRYKQWEVQCVIQKAVELITEAVGRGDSVVLRRFGVFSVKETKEKIGRNPKKPENSMVIPSRRVVKFKMGNKLREALSKPSK